MAYFAVFKCRLCEKKFVDCMCNKETAEKAIYFCGSGFDLSGLDLNSLKKHQCENGGIGLADFQGFKKVDF